MSLAHVRVTSQPSAVLWNFRNIRNLKNKIFGIIPNINNINKNNETIIFSFTQEFLSTS